MGYVIDTDIGGDIDDVLALLVAIRSHEKPLAITTTHIEPEEKARIAKLILCECGHKTDIPVYAGVGCRRTDPKEMFVEQNPLFPPMFGYPNPHKGDKFWYEKQSVAYRDSYEESFQKMIIEKEPAPEFIARLAKQYSKSNKLTIVALGPLHNVDAALKIDSSIAPNIILFSMGGGYPKGYNWLISPETTARVLSKVETVVVTSNFIIENRFIFTQGELQNIIKNKKSKLGQTVVSDWQNWHKGDFFNNTSTYLYDPITLYLALHPDVILSFVSMHVGFPCLDRSGKLRKSEFEGSWYCKPGLDEKIISLRESKEAQTRFVIKVKSPSLIMDHVYSSINDCLTVHPAVPVKQQQSNTQVSEPSQVSETISDKVRVVDLLNDARKAFLRPAEYPVKMLSGIVKLFKKEVNGKTYRIFGVDKEGQANIGYSKLRIDINTELGFSRQREFVQVIGDSATFSRKGTAYCREFLGSTLGKDNIILYGFTGYSSDRGNVADVNELINEWVNFEPERAKRVIANVVDKHTPLAIENWGCKVSENICNFFMVYTNDLEPQTRFGDDWLSDALTSKSAICLEGGIQSLSQVIFMLNNKVRIDCVVGLRDRDNTVNVCPSTGLQYLSASEFLNFLKNKLLTNEKSTSADIHVYLNEYLKTHALYNPTRNDAATKESLFKSAMLKFFDGEIWNKFDLLNVKLCPTHQNDCDFVGSSPKRIKRAKL